MSFSSIQFSRFLGLLVLFLMYSCSSEGEGKHQVIIESDLEEISGEFFVAGEYAIKGAESQTQEYARSGKYAYLADKNHEFGLSYSFEDVKKGDVIVFSAWKYSEHNRGSLVISDRNENGQSSSSGRLTMIENEWGLVKNYFIAENDIEELVLYIHNPHPEPAYFDDVRIEKYSNNKLPDDSHEALVIKLDDDAFAQIASSREIALEQGVITKDLKKYVKGFIIKDGNEIPIELRIKGDWTDHLKTDKWSFRIKVKGEHAFDGLKSFSIQNCLAK